jgi:DNA-binding CsgD family transcriptional regulator/tetratricopeptide (TPR) repeat protein
MELLERGPVLVQLSDLLHEASTGHGRLLFLGGEAGIGKTVLVRRFGQIVEQGARVLTGACDPLSTPQPLGPLLDLGAQLGPRWADMFEHTSARNLLFHRFLKELSDASQPLLVIFEDVHWADEATLDLLRFIGRRIDSAAALLIATYREDEVGPGHPLRQVLGELATSAGVRRLTLSPLSTASVRAMAEGSALDPAELHRQTGGNPFYVTEVLAAGPTGVPSTVRDAVLARVAQMPQAARLALDAAAVIGPRIEPHLLEELSGAGPEAIDVCVSSGVLCARGDALAFRHELAREAILSSLLPHRRLALDRAVLDALQRAPVCDTTRLAHHSEAARDESAVLRYAPEAARIAAHLSSHREAAAQYARALRFASALPPAERARLLECQSYEYYLTDQIPEAVAAREAALKIWRVEGDPLREGDCLRWLSRLYWFTGDRARAGEAGRAALQALEPLTPGRELAMALSNWAQLHMLAQRSTEAISWGERAIELAERLGDSTTLVHALNNVGSARLYEGHDSGREQLERSLALALEAGMEEHAARAYTNLSSILTASFQFELAERYLLEGLSYCTERDLDSWRLYMLGWHGVSLMRRGRWEEAVAAAEDGLRHPRLSPVSRIQALYVLGRIAALRGEVRGAALLEEALELARPTNELQRLAPVYAARAEIAWLSGETERIRPEADAVLNLALEQRDPWLAGELLYWSSLAEGQRQAPEWIAAPFALQLAGRWTEAADEWRRIGCPVEAACALVESGSSAALRAALHQFEHLRASALAKMARRRMRSAGERRVPRGPNRATRGNPLQLTRREMEILHLLAEGRKDAEIAGSIYVSSRTVGHHVSSILSKLGVRTRTEAAHEARRQGILKDT